MYFLMMTVFYYIYVVSIVCAIGVYVSAGNEGVVVFIVNLVVGVSGDVSDVAIVVVGFGN